MLLLRSGATTLRSQSRFMRSTAALRAGDRVSYDILSDLPVGSSRSIGDRVGPENQRE